MELAGFILREKNIIQLPDNVVQDIQKSSLNNIGMFMKNNCHQNSIIAAKTINCLNCENKIVEGVVRCEDGFLFEHYWNTVIAPNESSDYDVTLDVIASEEEKNTPKKYFEYKTFSISEMELKGNFSQEIEDMIWDYYEKTPTHKDRYYNQKMELLKKNFSFNSHRVGFISELEEYIDFLKSIFEWVDIVIYGSFITEKEVPNDIDIIVFGKPNQNGWDTQFKGSFGLPAHYGKIHIRNELFVSKKLTPKELVDNFNNQETNKLKGILIDKYIAIKVK